MLQSSANQAIDTLKKLWDMVAQKINSGEEISEEDLNIYLILLDSLINLLSGKNYSKSLDEKIADIILNVKKKDDVGFLYKILKNLGLNNSRRIFGALKNYLYFWKKSPLIGNKLSNESKLAYLILFDENQIIYLLNGLSSQQLFNMFKGNINFERNFFSNDKEKVINIGDFQKNFFYSLSKINESKEVQNFYIKLGEESPLQNYFSYLPTNEIKKNLFEIIFGVGAKYPPHFNNNIVEAHDIWQNFFKAWRKIFNEDESIVFEILISEEIKNIIQNSKNNFFLNFFLEDWNNKIEINKVREIIFSHLTPNQKKIFYNCFNDYRKSFISFIPQILKSFFAENYLSYKEKIPLFNLIFYEHKNFEFIVENIEEFSEDVKEYFYNCLQDTDNEDKEKMIMLLDKFDRINELIDFFSKKYFADAIRRIKALDLKHKELLISTILMNVDINNFQLDSLNSEEKFFVFHKNETKNNYEKLSCEMQAFAFIILLKRSLNNSQEKFFINNETIIQTENYEEIKFSSLHIATKILISIAIKESEFFLHILESDMSCHSVLNDRIKLDILCIDENCLADLKFNDLPTHLQVIIFLYSIKKYVEDCGEKKEIIITYSTKIRLIFFNCSISISELDKFTCEVLLLYYDKKKISLIIAPNLLNYFSNSKFILKFEQNIQLGEKNKKIRQSFSDLLILEPKSTDNENINSSSNLPIIPKMNPQTPQQI